MVRVSRVCYSYFRRFVSRVLYSVFTNKRYDNKEHYFFDSVLHKSRYTAWLIVLGLYVLAYHQRLVVSTIGYGDVSATTTQERILGMCLMIVGCCFFGKCDACEQRFEDIVSSLETFVLVRGIPHALKEKPRNYYVRYPSRPAKERVRCLLVLNSVTSNTPQ